MIVPAAVQQHLWCRLLEWCATFTRCIHPNRDLPVTAWTSCGVQVVIPNCFYTLYLTFTLPNHAILTHTAYLPPTPLPFTPSLPLLPHTITLSSHSHHPFAHNPPPHPLLLLWAQSNTLCMAVTPSFPIGTTSPPVIMAYSKPE